MSHTEPVRTAGQMETGGTNTVAVRNDTALDAIAWHLWDCSDEIERARDHTPNLNTLYHRVAVAAARAARLVLQADDAGAGVLADFPPGFLRVNRKSDEDMLWLWRTFIVPLAVGRCPDFFANDAEAVEFPTIQIGTDGRPIRKPSGREKTDRDDWTAEQLMSFVVTNSGKWSRAMRALADLITTPAGPGEDHSAATTPAAGPPGDPRTAILQRRLGEHGPIEERSISDTPIRAGKAFLESLRQNPEELARVRDVAARWANVIRAIGPNLEREIREGVESARRELQAAGYPWRGENLEPWEHIARIMEEDPGPLKLGQIRDKALAWIDRQKILERIKYNIARSAPAAETFHSTPVLISLGERNYRVGEQTVVLEDSEDAVLQVFAERAGLLPAWIALDQPTLRQESGYLKAPRILRALQTKHPELASVIQCPGKKGQGGFKVYVMKPTRATDSPR